MPACDPQEEFIRIAEAARACVFPLKMTAVFYLPRAHSVRITMQTQLHEENDHGKRPAKKEQGSQEAQEEADTGYLSCRHIASIEAGDRVRVPVLNNSNSRQPMFRIESALANRA